MNNDQIIGAIMAGFGAIFIILETYLLIIQPLANDTILKNFPAAQYWGLAIPLFLGVFGVLAIVIWIGYTMVNTPPPEAWDFEDFQEEIEEESKSE